VDRLGGLGERLTYGLGRLWEERTRRSIVVASVLAAVLVLTLTASIVAALNGNRPAAEAARSRALDFAVLAGSTVRNTGPSVITGDLGGVRSGDSIRGFPPGVIVGDQHAADEVALQAQSDLSAAYSDAANRQATDELPRNLVGLTLQPGVHRHESDVALTGTLTLDGRDNSDSLFILQAGATLSTEPDSKVRLINGAQACNVFWQVGSSATLGTDSEFVGSVLALASVTVQKGAAVTGRVLARMGEVSMNDNTITLPKCDDPQPASPFIKVAPPVVDPGATPTTTSETSDEGNGDGDGNETDETRTTTRRPPGSTTTPGSSTAPSTTRPTTTTQPTTTDPTTEEPTSSSPTTTEESSTSAPTSTSQEATTDPTTDPPESSEPSESPLLPVPLPPLPV